MSGLLWLIQVSISSILLILLIHHFMDFTIEYFSPSVIYSEKLTPQYTDTRDIIQKQEITKPIEYLSRRQLIFLSNLRVGRSVFTSAFILSHRQNLI